MQVKILLLANQPERTTRLRMFEGTLKDLGYEVVVPRFNTRNWISIAGLARKVALAERPDVVHIFNVPDIIYHNFPNLRGEGFKKLIYDYRSPWGLELQQTFGAPGKAFGERFERELAQAADIITTVNRPLGEKARSFAPDKEPHVIPNYPLRSFSELKDREPEMPEASDDKAPIIFIGRVCTQEGIQKLLEVAKAIPEQEFWIVGGGPFAWWYLRNKPPNVKDLGWQPHEKVAGFVRKAKLCLIPREESVITPYSTDKSVWKLNEYLNMGKLVVASGISREEPRKNLIIVESAGLKEAIIKHLDDRPQKMSEEDYKYWDSNKPTIKKVYESL
ncbi:MAG TPA: glycosyltransferase [Methanotrichaceae archaeon]|nr:glycosyltransferase [Methanotrichaceae archaeon]